MSDIYISWLEYHQKIEELAVKIYQSSWDFNQIVCIARGGLRVGDILSRLYRQPLAIFSAASYGGLENRIRGKITLSQHLAMTTSELGNKVLLVDDLVDSGVSLQESIQWLQQHYCDRISQIRTAVLWYKANSAIAPDYYVEYLPHNPWIHQPFEPYDRITLCELAQRYPPSSRVKRQV
ncbi:MAG TPA: phosphoribosyltransferase [Cyanobacteria bacterium UBA11159]|nr:phosphoribosyltransferase [Cyanobacteria bacterium UBA11367]HBE57265.1 phosphoribosyltransferase [Cyanobacteria bacterium UBA11366]HBK65120.1 phosphoribosyltransferase [Cyanobacteria bacterium UBA11166]HBR73986.1 phosphoribosyltransferase [Cyanobacteria bacterium UBA11159]HBS68843.1 phosphoribosyltransferase [Cyanobacteria bacterium UBA11153]HCA93157.1 phosphoribosyltransferase [Cyanobacteria bacterium UBA9226]